MYQLDFFLKNDKDDERNAKLDNLKKNYISIYEGLLFQQFILAKRYCKTQERLEILRNKYE